ncbi:polysaccharide biosynthesis C-terminal domain-containing protein [Halorubellus sp. PRR65]|uniref:oligosaccharide flippase family protein n=1 Tax=Halorubellus sp. PRR65 TaxID=3098148 RepID=UPI002B262A37|nr:polysaccharide biosynthesis C-terminal domain-containing protein [Halorubellus sp. PRR65]
MTQDDSSVDIKSETIIGGFGRSLLLVGGFGEIILLTRYFKPSLVGFLYIALAVAQVASQTVEGFTIAIRKKVSEAETNPPDYLGLGLLAGFVYGIVVYAAYAIIWLLLDYRPFEISSEVAAYVAFVSIALGLFVVAKNTYSGLGNPGNSMILNAGRTVLRVILVILVISINGGIVELLISVAAANLALTVVILSIMRVTPRIPNRKTIFGTMTFARFSIPNAFVLRLYSRLDVILLGILVGGAAAGYYESALRLTVPAITISTAVGQALTVKASEKSSAGLLKTNDVLSYPLRYAGVFAYPMIIGAVVIGDQVLKLFFTPSYLTAWSALIGLSIYQLAHSYRIQFSMLSDGIGRPNLNLYINTITTIAYLPVAVSLGLIYGLVGIIIATVTTESARIALYLRYLRTDSIEPAILAQIAPQVVAATLMGGLIYIIRNLVNATSNLGVVLLLIIGVTTYVLSLLLLDGGLRSLARNRVAVFRSA